MYPPRSLSSFPRKLLFDLGYVPCFRDLISRVNAATVWLPKKKVKKMKIKSTVLCIINYKQRLKVKNKFAFFYCDRLGTPEYDGIATVFSQIWPHSRGFS